MKIIDNKNSKMIPLRFLDMGDIFEYENEICMCCHVSENVPGIECFNLTKNTPFVRADSLLVTPLSDVTLTINR